MAKKYDPDKTWKEQQREDELSWQGKACKYIRAAGGYAEKIEFKAKGGCPDIMASMPYKAPYLLEFKMGVMKVDPLQKSIFRDMINGGFRIKCICVFAENDQIWFIHFNFETGKEVGRCLPEDISALVWGKQ